MSESLSDSFSFSNSRIYFNKVTVYFDTDFLYFRGSYDFYLSSPNFLLAIILLISSLEYRLRQEKDPRFSLSLARALSSFGKISGAIWIYYGIWIRNVFSVDGSYAKTSFCNMSSSAENLLCLEGLKLAKDSSALWSIDVDFFFGSWLNLFDPLFLWCISSGYSRRT